MMRIHLHEAYTVRELIEMADATYSDIDLGNATATQLDRLVLEYFTAI